MTRTRSNIPKNICDVLHQDIISYIDKLGVKIEVERHIGLKDPSLGRTGLLIGRDVIIPKDMTLHLGKKTINAIINDWYARIGKNRDDYFHFGVRGLGRIESDKYGDSKIVDNSYFWDHLVQGFMEVSKADMKALAIAVNDHQNSTADHDLEVMAREIVTKEMDKYNSWIHTNIFDITVSDKESRLAVTQEAVYINSIDVNLAVEPLLVLLVEQIDNLNDAIQLVFNMDIEQLSSRFNGEFKNDAVGFTLRALSVDFGIDPTVGSVACDYSTGEVSITIVGDSIDSFKQINEHCGGGIIEFIKESVEDLSDSDIDKWHIIGTLMNKPFIIDWDQNIKFAFFKAVLKSSINAQLISVT